jgi:hypothetical protein
MRGAPLLVFIEWAVCLVLCLIVHGSFVYAGWKWRTGWRQKSSRYGVRSLLCFTARFLSVKLSYCPPLDNQ